MKPINNVCIVGAGTMGFSLAVAFIAHGKNVRLHDMSEARLPLARNLIASALDTLDELNLLTANERNSSLARLHLTTSLEEAGGDADLVIEAIVEDKSAKHALFKSLDKICPAHAILASNTSFLDIFTFMETSRPEKVIIAHWFNPPHIVPLVEIVRGPQTSQETVDAIRQLLVAMGKQPIVISKFLPGFIANRLQSALRNEALFLLDNGYCTPEEIDLAAMAGFGLRIPITGVVQRMDFAGLDVTQKVLLDSQFQQGPQIRQSNSIDQQVAGGRLGVKNGKGFYDYGGRSTQQIVRDVDIKLIKLVQFLEELEKT